MILFQIRKSFSPNCASFLIDRQILKLACMGKTKIHFQNSNVLGALRGKQRLSMELDLQSLFGLLCTAVLIGWDLATPSLPPLLGAYPWALLVSQDRRHLSLEPSLMCRMVRNNTIFGWHALHYILFTFRPFYRCFQNSKIGLKRSARRVAVWRGAQVLMPVHIGLGDIRGRGAIVLCVVRINTR